MKNYLATTRATAKLRASAAGRKCHNFSIENQYRIPSSFTPVPTAAIATWLRQILLATSGPPIYAASNGYARHVRRPS